MMYETTSKETEMMHGRTTKRSCMGVPTIVHFYKAVSQSCLLVSSVQLAHSKQELCRSRAKLCRDISEGDTHLCKRTSETGYLPFLPFRIKCDRATKKNKHVDNSVPCCTRRLHVSTQRRKRHRKIQHSFQQGWASLNPPFSL